MQVTVFNGSPRGRRSNTHRIVEPLLEGAAEAGARTEEVFLVERNIKHCLGCFSCWGRSPGQCVQHDDMPPLLELFVDSDCVGFATPVYGMFMTAILKNFTERLLPLNTPHMHRDEEGRFYHEGRWKRLPRMFMIANAGFPGGHNFELLKTYMAMQEPVLEVYRDCGEILGNLEEAGAPETETKVADFYEALRSAGREMVAFGCVRTETLERLHVELMPEEDYMDMVNRSWDDADRA